MILYSTNLSVNMRPGIAPQFGIASRRMKVTLGCMTKSISFRMRERELHFFSSACQNSLRTTVVGSQGEQVLSSEERKEGGKRSQDHMFEKLFGN